MNFVEMPQPFKLPIESFKIRISRRYVKPITIIAIYRPSDTIPVLEALEAELISNGQNEMYLIGDFNLSNEKSKFELKTLLYQTTILPTYHKPTRTTAKCTSIHDLIITNRPNFQIKRLVLEPCESQIMI